jgi:hypothetical protein
MLFNQTQLVGYSRLHVFRKAWTIKQVRLRIYELLRPLVLRIPDFSNYHGKELSYDEQLLKEYDHFFL